MMLRMKFVAWGAVGSFDIMVWGRKTIGDTQIAKAKMYFRLVLTKLRRCSERVVWAEMAEVQ